MVGGTGLGSSSQMAEFICCVKPSDSAAASVRSRFVVHTVIQRGKWKVISSNSLEPMHVYSRFCVCCLNKGFQKF